MSFYEHYKRSIAKTISYRILIVIATFLLFYLMTGDRRTAAETSIIWNLIGMVLYFFHERLWNLSHWGKHPISKSKSREK